mmetsp:Transcript_31192/g.71645  ORF Transcript_31192/g.71645 Transcript_31192/m.71645 type:complete len:277 (-) Transcript_31192:70-900(-)
MDLALEIAGDWVLDPMLWKHSVPRDNTVRQLVDLYLVYCIGGALMYLIPATLDFYFLFDKKWMQDKQWIPGQVALELKLALSSIPQMSLLMTVVSIWELKGHSRLYDNVSDFGLPYFVFSIFAFFMFTDCLVYWFHRWLHLPVLYKHIQKPHHKWKVASPFASHAFHPLDGFIQGFPYHIAVFIFPVHKVLWMCMFVAINMWTISIHDGHFAVPNWKWARWLVNGAAHHTDHHLFFNYNYGQYFTIWDRIGGSYMYPTKVKQAEDADAKLKLAKAA